FVAAPARRIEEAARRRRRPQRRGGDVVGLVPGDAPQMRLAVAPGEREADTSGRFQLPRAPAFELGNAMGGEERLGNWRLHVGGRSLPLLLTHLGEAAVLVVHAALLPPHAQRAGFAWVAAVQPACQPRTPAGIPRLA